MPAPMLDEREQLSYALGTMCSSARDKPRRIEEFLFSSLDLTIVAENKMYARDIVDVVHGVYLANTSVSPWKFDRERFPANQDQYNLAWTNFSENCFENYGQTIMDLDKQERGNGLQEIFRNYDFIFMPYSAYITVNGQKYKLEYIEAISKRTKDEYDELDYREPHILDLKTPKNRTRYYPVSMRLLPWE